jgi:hypothetical protein
MARVWILYKEAGQFPATIKPVYSLGGRALAKVEDDTFNYLTGNVKVIDRAIAEVGAAYYGKNKKKHYIRADGSPNSSSRVDGEDTKVEEELDEFEKEYSEKLYKLVLISNVEDVFHDRFKALNKNKPELESSTWSVQAAEAKEYLNDNTVDTPILSIIATARGITVLEQANKIKTKEDAYNLEVATLLSQQMALTDEIKACVDVKALCKWNEDNFGIQMNMAWANEYGLMDETGVNRLVPVINEVKF